MKRLPHLLIYSRLISAFVIPVFAVFAINAGFWIVGLMILAVISDIFDGIIARKLGLATEKLRALDSNVDVVFWLATIFTLFALNASFVRSNGVLILVLFGLEAGCYAVAFLKYKRTVATHTILAKAWTLTLLLFLIDLALNNGSNWPFWICMGLGIVSRLEIIAILLLLKKWRTDVPSFLSVRKINQGENPLQKALV